MANYIVQGDLDVLLSDADLQDLTDDDASGSIDSAIVTKAIVAGQAEIDNALAGRYDVPLSSPSQTVKEWNVAFAALWLYERRRVEPGDIFMAKIKNIRDRLKRIEDGKSTLDGVDGAPSPKNSDPISVSSNTRRLSRSTMSGW